jgi:hypothetical protein
MEDRLIGLWCPSFSGATQGILPDLSGKDNNCSFIGLDRNTAWQTVVDKNALFHDGIDDRVFNNSFSMSAMSDQSNSFSIWINPTATNVNSRILGIGSFGTSFSVRFNFGNLEFAFGGTAVLSVQMPNNLFANRWTHVCGVSNANGARMFLNGVLVGSRTDTVSITKTNGLGIGYRFGVNTEFYLGYTDDLRVFARTLSENETVQIFENQRGGGLLHEPPKRRSFFVPTLPLPVRRRSSRFLTFPG